MNTLRRYLILTMLFFPLLLVSVGPFARAGEETRNVTLTPDADAYVWWIWDHYGTYLIPYTYGSSTGIFLRTDWYGYGGQYSVGYVKFPMPSISVPQYAHVVSATLQMYYYGYTQFPPTGTSLLLSRVTSSWTESSAGSATFTTEDRSSTPSPSTVGWFSIDVAGIVQKWLNWPSPSPNYGFRIELSVPSWGADANFYSREMQGYEPKLTIQYSASFTTTTAQTARTETMLITVVLPCTKDATLDPDLPSGCYGLTLDVYPYTHHDGTRDYGIIAFDDPISKIPPGSIITSATLCASGNHISALRFFRVTAPWAERTVCWDNRPSYDSSTYRSYTDGLAYFVQLWLDGTPNHGLFMENYLYADECWFYSRQKTEYPPVLSVSFIPPSLTGFGWTTISTATISTWYPGSTVTIEETLSYRISTTSLLATTTWHTTTTTSTGTVTSLTFVTTTTTTLLLAPAPINALYNRTRTHTQTNGGE